MFLFAENNPTAALVREAATRIAGAVSPDDASDAVYPDDVPALLSRHAWAGYEAAGGPSHPTWQRPLPGREGRSAEPPPNVVLVLMESMRGLEMRGPFRALPVTPQLGSLEARALVFPNFYANGVTTVDAEFSVLCSALPVVGRAPVYIRKPELRIRCLPEILREHGYETHWISAYRADYANKRRFLEAHGVETIHDQASFDLSRAMNPPVGWGMGDVDMFEQALEKMDGFDEPFFAEVMTLSNHHPFDHDYGLDFPDFTRVPGEAHYHDYLRGMHYTDHAVGSFVRAALQRPWGQRTVFVILGDHGVRSFPTTENGERAGPVLETEIFFRNRLILLAPGRVEPGVSPLVGSQIDLAPTLLDVLGIRSENGFLGVSLLAPLDAERRHAWMNVGHAFNFRSGNRYCFSVGYSCFERAFPRCEEGVEPTAIGHTCFELEGDLFDAGAARAVRVLEAQEGAATPRARRAPEPTESPPDCTRCLPSVRRRLFRHDRQPPKREDPMNRKLLVLVLGAALTSSGCTTLQNILDFEEQVQEAQQSVRITGTIRTEGPADGNLVVLVGSAVFDEDGKPVIQENGIPQHLGLDLYTRRNPGSFLFILTEPGKFRLGAYEDRNRNGDLDAGERYVRVVDSELIELEAGESRKIDLVITDALRWEGEPIDVLGIVERDAHAQGIHAIRAFSKKGEVAPLSDDRFARDKGSFGLWKPMDFLNEELAGVYFTEEYDPDRIPVLFVHGIMGFPQEFEKLVDELDRTRFQAWFYFYPSGFGLNGISDHLADLLRELQVRHDFDEIAIVAHSMGGLVSRGAILKYFSDTQREDVEIFVSINSPFGGSVAAKRTEDAPIEIPPSFKDMNPDSEYMTWVFYEDETRTRFKELPGEIPHHMIMGYGGEGEPYNDGAVSIESQAHVDLQEHAASVRVWNFSHVGTLHEERTVSRVNTLLRDGL